jgi:putative ABC transport system permease protein
MSLSIWQDARVGFRMLRKNPGFTITAAVTLALGIGANTAIFSAVNALLLRPIPVKDAGRVVLSIGLREGFDPFGIGLLDFTAFRDRSHSFLQCGVSVPRSFNLIEGGQPEHARGAAVDAGYLSTLGVRPMLGRTFTAEDDRPGGPAVALVGYGLWQRRFGGDEHLVGRSVLLEGREATIIGLLPRAFDLPAATQIWVPLQANVYGLPLEQRATHEYDMVARLKPGVSVDQADAELKEIARQLEREYPQFRRSWGVKALPLRQQVVSDLNGNLKRGLYTLLGAVGLFLLICCVNVANLMLARGVAREQEMAIRRALGADWRRLMGQLLTESSIVALLGGSLGLLLAYSIVPLLASLNPVESVALAGVLNDIRIDGRVLAFVVAIAIASALICPLLSIVRVRATNDPMRLIREGGQRGSTGSGRNRWLGALIVVEIAIAVPLLIGGALMIQSFERLQHMNLGFESNGRVTMHFELSRQRYPQARQRTAFVKRVLDRVEELPDVLSAGTTTNLPLSPASFDSVFTVEGRPVRNAANIPITAHRLISAAYLQSLGVRLIKGRLFDQHDTAQGLPAVVVSQEFARQAWPGEDPIGKRVKRGNQSENNSRWLTVVGVVKDVKEDRENFRIDRPVWYLPYDQQSEVAPTDQAASASLDLLVNARGNPASIIAEIREAVRSVDPDQPISEASTMQAHVASVIASDRFNSILLGALAILGLTLAVIGLYGVMAYTVRLQTAEMGLRAALGASPPDILRMVVGNGARLVGAGLIAGLLGSVLFTRLLSGVLFGVKAADPVTFGAVSVLLAGVALVACCVPGLRAARIDPLTALRYE